MKRTRTFLPAVRALCAAALLAVPFTAHAQQTEERFQSLLNTVSANAQASHREAQGATTGSRKARGEKKTALKRLLLSMQNKEAEARAAGVLGSAGDGITLLAESSVADAPVTPITETTTALNVEAQLDKIVRELPRGSRWVKLMLPPTPKNKTLHGDDVADYALAQARMYGSVGETVLPKDGVEVISQPLSGDKAKVVVPARNLRPVYLLLNPDAHVAFMRGQRNSEYNTAVLSVLPQMYESVGLQDAPLQLKVTVSPPSGDE